MPQSTAPEPRGVTRRHFLGYVIAGPTLVTGVQWLNGGEARATTVPSGGQIAESYDLLDFLRDAARPTANLITITVNEDGTVSFALHRTEVGQGINTAIAMVIAEEMDLPVERVRITQADARPELLFNQLTGGSNSMFTIYDPVRLAAAVARKRLIDAAAIFLGASGSSLSILDGTIRAPDGSTVGFGELARDAASSVTEPVDAEPKSGDFAVVGTPHNRVDSLAMVTGQHQYVLDLQVPDALPTMVCRPPTINGTPRAIRNEDQVRAMPGITDIAMVATGVAVRARTFGQCIDAVRALDVSWGPGTVDDLSDDDVQAALADAELPQVAPDLSALDLGGGLGALGLSKLVPKTLDATFTFAFQPNCPLEANPAIASVADGKAEIWAPMKTPITAQQDIAEALGLPQDKVTCHVVQGGGSFGRDLFWDGAREAALISQAMGKPVKLLWHRTDDFRQGRTHPACRSSIRATYTGDAIVAFTQHHTSVNTDFGHGLGEILTRKFDELPGGLGGMGFSQSVFALTQFIPYDFGVVEQLLNETLPAPGEVETNLFRTSSMRNIYSPNVVTARELVIDRIVADMGADPYEFRLATVKDERGKAVLRKAAEVGEWGKTMAPGTAQGIGFHNEYKGRAACVVEIDTTPATVGRHVEGAYTGPRVTRATFVVDVGLAVNPRGLEAQMMGGTMDGIANALTYSLHLDQGMFAEDSWEHAYYTRQWNAPFDVQVVVLQSSSQPGGAGELGVAASMAATACAYARATGTMPTQFPINHDQPLPDTISPRGTVPQSPTDGIAKAGR